MPSRQGYDLIKTGPMGTLVDETGDPTSAAGLPSTHSSQQLMPQDSCSVTTSDNSLRIIRSESSGGFRSISKRDWFTVGVLCFVNLINYMDRFTIAGVLTDIQKTFDKGDDAAGLLQTVFVISYMICAPIFGYLGDRHSRKIIMAVGVFLWSATTLAGSFMLDYGWFTVFRALVGIGEASYSTIAPTIISDLFVNDVRSKMLALFYFAIPVGSGFGYIVGSKAAAIAQDWRYALRVTPVLGIIAVVMIFLIKEPERGQSEGSHNLEATSYREDLKDLIKNRSFMLSTGGFTCVAFVAGALAFWGPTFILYGLRMQPGNENVQAEDVSYKFGLIAMAAGIVGVPLGSFLAQRLRPLTEQCDPLICAAGLFASAPLVYFVLLIADITEAWCYFLIFFAETTLNMCWPIVADMVLYVVIPTRRSTAEAFQILISHALGDAGSPYFIGVVSEAIKKAMHKSGETARILAADGLESYALTVSENRTVVTTENKFDPVQNSISFEALQYSLFSTSFVEIIGGIFFLFTALYIIHDKKKATRAVKESQTPAASHTYADSVGAT